MASRVLPDANVLFSRTLRDWFFMLSFGHVDQPTGPYLTYFTVDIVAEALSRLRDKYPDLDGERVALISDRIHESMTARITSYPIPLDCPVSDPGDRHVHAAALAGDVDYLVTADKGFTELPESVKAALPYEILSPDEFFIWVCDVAPDVVREVTRQQLNYWQSRGCTNIATPLVESGCPKFADRVRIYLQAVS